MPYYGHNGKTNGSCKQLALYKQQTLNHPKSIIFVIMLLLHAALTAFSNMSLLAHFLCPASPRTKNPSSFLPGDVISAPEDFMISLIEHPSFPMT